MVLGAVLSLTVPASSKGSQQAQAIELAMQINGGGGIGGAPVQMFIKDDGSDPATGAQLMGALAAKDRALAVIGPTTSEVAIAANPVADQRHMPVIAVSNVVSGIVGSCAHPCSWIWRDSVADAVAVPDAISFVVQTSRPRAAAIVYSAPNLLGGRGCCGCRERVQDTVGACRGRHVRPGEREQRG